MGSISPVVVARFVFLAVAAAAAATVVYTCVTDGSPFRMEILTPWMAATLVDFYANVLVLATWVLYKEESYVSKMLWVAGLICLGSPITCLYVAIQLFKIKTTDPLYHILLKERHARFLASAEL